MTTTAHETTELPPLAPATELTFQKADTGQHTADAGDRWYSAVKMPTGWEVRQYENGTPEPVKTHREGTRAECIVTANYWEAKATGDTDGWMYWSDVYGDL